MHQSLVHIVPLIIGVILGLIFGAGLAFSMLKPYLDEIQWAAYRRGLRDGLDRTEPTDGIVTTGDAQ